MKVYKLVPERNKNAVPTISIGLKT